LTFKASLGNRPVIYEIVPPRRDTSRFQTELRGVDDVLHDSRIAAINVPELTNRIEQKGQVHYSPTTIPPEEYAVMIKEYKEAIVNIIAPRLEKEEFLRRTHKILHEYRIPSLVLVGRERHEDTLPGPGVVEALRLLEAQKRDDVALGGICIFNRNSSTADEYGSGSSGLSEHMRIWLKASAGCDFVTSQITFDPETAVNFLSSYQELCEATEKDPLTVFISLATVPSPGILSLLDRLDVVVPSRVRKRLLGSGDMGRESLRIATEVFQEIVSQTERSAVRVPIGLQIEQVGVHSGGLSLSLLDSTYSILKSNDE
jgi:5,10-methylenetetrahydrofolate reductase